MSERTQNLLSKNYAPAVLGRLSRLPSRDQLPIATWLIKTPIGTNYAMQILEQLEDLSKKEEVGAAQVLNRFLRDLDANRLHPKEVGKRLRDILYQRLHPQSTQHHYLFNKITQGLGLPKGVQIHPPKNFEGSSFSLEIAFREPGELSQRLQELLETLEKKPWKGLSDF